MYEERHWMKIIPGPCFVLVLSDALAVARLRSVDRARIVRRRGLETVFIAAPQATLRHQAERRTAETPHPGRIYIKWLSTFNWSLLRSQKTSGNPAYLILKWGNETMNDKECLMIDEQKSFIYMNQTDGCWYSILIFWRIILPSRQQATMQWVWWTSSRSDEYLTLQFVGKLNISWLWPEMHPVAITSVEVMVWRCDGVSWRGVITFPTCNSPSNSAAPIRRTADGRSDITNIIRLPHSLYIHYSLFSTMTLFGFPNVS